MRGKNFIEKFRVWSLNLWSFRQLFFLMIIVAILWSLSIFIVHSRYPNWQESGTFGDTFGGINSIFSGLAFAGIIFTIFQQKRELSLQREELKLQRKEVKLTRKEFVQQNNTLKRQLFENTFFNMINQHNQIVNSMDFDVVRYVDGEQKLTPSNPLLKYYTTLQINEFEENNAKKVRERYTISDRDVFEYHYKIFLHSITGEDRYSYEKAYHDYWEEVQGDFGHYFRNLYRVLKMVSETSFFEESDIDFDRKATTKRNYLMQYRYTSIIRAQLSDYELLWLFYNGLSKYGQEKMKPLINRFSILKNISTNKLDNSGGYRKSIIAKYDNSAFEKKDLSSFGELDMV